MTDGQTTQKDELEGFLKAILFMALAPKTEQMNKGTGTSKAEPKLAGSNPTVCVSDGIDPAIEAQLEAIFNAKRGEQTYGEKLVGFDPVAQYSPVVSETLQDFADIIDVLCNSNSMTNARLAIEAIQVANFWTQKALAESTL